MYLQEEQLVPSLSSLPTALKPLIKVLLSQKSLIQCQHISLFRLSTSGNIVVLEEVTPLTIVLVENFVVLPDPCVAPLGTEKVSAL